jgi:hypothetical protein
MRRSLTRRFAAGLAILAMGLNGLWPLLANAAPVEFVAPICSMVGTTVAVDAGGMPVEPAPAKSPAPHCPFCSTGSDHNPALATAETIAFAVPESMPQPLVSDFAPKSSFTVLAAPPRGPPSRLI